MTRVGLEKVAANLIRTQGRQQLFSFSLPSEVDLEVLAAILRDQYDCTVVSGTSKHRINIHYAYDPMDELPGVRAASTW